MNEALQCPGCGVGFVRTKRNQRFHDRECQVRHNNEQAVAKRETYNANRRVKAAKTRPMAEFQCEGCGAVKTAPIQRRPRRFCSRTCKNLVHNREWQAANPGRIREYNRSPLRREANRQRSSSYYHANRDTIAPIVAAKFQATRLSAPWRTLLMGAKSRAKAKGLAFDLTEKWAINRWTGACELTGIAFELGKPKESPRGLWASIDRMKPERGYTQENCRFILHAVNAFKGELSDAAVLCIAKELVRCLSSNKKD